MTSKLESALKLASLGFRVFPLISNSKLPAIKNFSEVATTDEAQIRLWWGRTPNANIGISTHYKNGCLVIPDIDNKEGKNGSLELEKLKAEGFKFPPTIYQTTPTGGIHLFYTWPVPIKQGVSVLAPGIDIRANGGYVVGAGSTINGLAYSIHYEHPIHECPIEIVEKCGSPIQRKPNIEGSTVFTQTVPTACDRGIEWLLKYAPLAIQGQGGDSTTLKVCLHLKDLGIAENDMLELLGEYWNDRCSPPWETDDLIKKIENAFQYGKNDFGTDAPETEFDTIPNEIGDPIDRMNEDHAFILIQGHSKILWETSDYNNNFETTLLSPESFHQKFAAEKMNVGDKPIPITKVWMASPKRRSYDGICFSPGRPPKRDRYYNLWLGFNYDLPKSGERFEPECKKSLDDLLAHTFENICRGKTEEYNWIMSYFSQLIQTPYFKPQTAVVFKGEKGVGKNTFIERIGALIHNHFFITADSKHLISNFNAHFERCLLFVLDEAAWQYDKHAEGKLKSLITGSTHEIERKGHEIYKVENLTRVCIVGNDEFIVPASYDDRRYTVFEVGEKRKGDTKYFESIRLGMESGGYKLLLHHLMNYKINANINVPLVNSFLLDQKIQNLKPIERWWFQSLTDGRLCNSEHDSWIQEATVYEMRDAYKRFYHGLKLKYDDPTFEINLFGKKIKRFCKGYISKQKREGGSRIRISFLPSLEECRKEWEFYIKHFNTDWGDENDNR